MSIQLKCFMVISVSRRCDIPRFQLDMFMERINEGFIETANPFNPRQIKRVSLLPQDVSVFVFWTRDPRHILACADELTERGFSFYVMVTLTNYPAALEPDMPCVPEVISAMKELSRKIGADRVIWRYDPILLSSVTHEDFHKRNFDELARSLAGSVRRVIVSLYDDYPRARRRLEALENSGLLQMPDAGGDYSEILKSIVKSAEAAKMEIQSCAQKEDFSSLGIKPGACIDAALIKKLSGLELGGKDKYQRPHCLCCKSADIGIYGICKAGCAYCYAC